MTAPEAPFVTVLTPVYNGEDYLAECIESVLKQKYQNFEYIIVNNCSTDRSLAIAQEYATKDRRIRVHTNERFVEVIDNHNIAFGLVAARAKYCKVVSADDLIFPDCISQMVELAEKNPAIGFVGAYQLSGGCVKWQGFSYPQQIFNGLEIGRWILSQRQSFVDGQPVFGFGSPTSLLYRADLLRRWVKYFPNPSPHSDTSAGLRDLAHCDFGFLYQILSFERLHQKTQSSKSIEMNGQASAYLSDLIDYGSFYFDAAERRSKISSALREYQRYLAINLFRSRDKTFWDYHKGRLQELGYPLARWTLFKAAVAVTLEAALNPGRVARRIWKRV